MIKEILGRKIGYLVSSRSTRVGVIQHSSSLDSDSWIVKSHLDGSVISSHHSLVEAKKSLRSIHKYSSLIPRIKEKEVIVWLWQMHDMDKQQLLEFVRDKFNLNESDSERLYSEAFPQVLTEKEEEVLDNFDQEIEERELSIPLDMVNTMLEIHADGVSPQELLKFDDVQDDVSFALYNIVESMLKARKLS